MPKRIKKSDEGKAWNRKKRPSKWRVQVAERILIVCEGETEKSYFSSFDTGRTAVKIVVVHGNYDRLVRYALLKNDDYTSTWSVFDFDNDPSDMNQNRAFDEAMRLAKKKKICVAYSNDCFEYWYCLHYAKAVSLTTRKSCFEFLSKRWEIEYGQQGKKWMHRAKHFARLEKDKNASQTRAVSQAKIGYEKQQYLPPHQQNPVTLVYRLVEELNRHKN